MNYDVICNIALYLSYDDLKHFLLLTKNAIKLSSDRHFWLKKFEHEGLPILSNDCKNWLVEYETILHCKKNAKLILLINDIESQSDIGPDGMINLILPEHHTNKVEKYEYLIDKIVNLLPNYSIDPDPMLEDFIICTDNLLNGYNIRYPFNIHDNREERISLCSKEQVEYFLIIALYYDWIINDNCEVDFIFHKDILKDPDLYKNQVELYTQRIAIIETLKYYNKI